MRNSAFSTCKKQRHRSAAADQRLCFCYIDSTLLSSIRNYKPLAIFCACTAWFVSDVVGNPEDKSSHDEAYLNEMQYSHMHHCVFIQFIHDVIQFINSNLLLI